MTQSSTPSKVQAFLKDFDFSMTWHTNPVYDFMIGVFRTDQEAAREFVDTAPLHVIRTMYKRLNAYGYCGQTIQQNKERMRVRLTADESDIGAKTEVPKGMRDIRKFMTS